MLGETSEADGYYSLLLFELIVLIIMSESRSFSGLVIEFPSTRKQLNFAANTHTQLLLLCKTRCTRHTREKTKLSW